jgi:hypothetical protein
MQILTLPIHYVRNKRARRRRVQTVLHMLSVSGVLRPGHVEPRYFEPSIRVDALHRQGSGRSRRQQPFTRTVCPKISASTSPDFDN